MVRQIYIWFQGLSKGSGTWYVLRTWERACMQHQSRSTQTDTLRHWLVKSGPQDVFLRLRALYVHFILCNSTLYLWRSFLCSKYWSQYSCSCYTPFRHELRVSASTTLVVWGFLSLAPDYNLSCVHRYLFKYIIIGDTGEGGSCSRFALRFASTSCCRKFKMLCALQEWASLAYCYSSLTRGFNLYMTWLSAWSLEPGWST